MAAELDRMESHTGYLLTKLGNAAGAWFEKSLQPTGLLARHVRVLSYIQTEQLSQQDLCRLTGMDRTTMVAVVDDLERLGFAQRETSQADRRKRVVTPTTTGTKALRTATKRMKEAEEALLAPLSPTEQQKLHTLLTKLFTPDLLNC